MSSIQDLLQAWLQDARGHTLELKGQVYVATGCSCLQSHVTGGSCHCKVKEKPSCQLSLQLSETVLEVDRIIMPVHLGNHWTCATIDLAAKELVYYDSMGVNRPRHAPGSPSCRDRTNISWC